MGYRLFDRKKTWFKPSATSCMALHMSRDKVLAAGLVGFLLVTASTLSSAILYIVHTLNSLDVEMQSVRQVPDGNGHGELTSIY